MLGGSLRQMRLESSLVGGFVSDNGDREKRIALAPSSKGVTKTRAGEVVAD